MYVAASYGRHPEDTTTAAPEPFQHSPVKGAVLTIVFEEVIQGRP